MGKLPKIKPRGSRRTKTTMANTCEKDGVQIDRRLKRKSRKPRASSFGHDQDSFKEAFRTFCERTLQTGVKLLAEEFITLKLATHSIGNRPKTAFDANPDKKPLQSGLKKCCDYINANWIKVADQEKKFICTQGPINKTINDFWRMIWQEKCKSIVMLCNVTECGEPKCEQYWPLTAESPMKLASGLTVKFISAEATEESVHLTKIEISDRKGAQLMVEHYHWTSWPDRDVPKTTTLTAFRILNRVNGLTPCVVHCSAGRGRTGTIVALDMLYRRLERGDKDVTLLEVVTELREMRHAAVQMDCQYVFMHHILLILAENLKIITAVETEKFQQEWEYFLKNRLFP
ncbi:hypothetical protein KIN20_022842 [Parelaphostrongylus tenuis]|uniref:Uncharacterized protein n=1 Tax=Parelaphostrongylus tenuis TaxID=148309 RepID=A0AAD5MR38_PARTN|nr:hypothetical protein KIN20_022842 [Parelaphostrongylus tenuis]